MVPDGIIVWATPTGLSRFEPVRAQCSARAVSRLQIYFLHPRMTSSELPDKAHSLGRVAYERLLEAIEKGTLRPGDRISVSALAELLDMSRTPVREAVAWLETDGLVVHEPYAGRVVSKLNLQMMNELYEIRQVLEVAAVGMAARNASEAEIAVLTEMLEYEQSILDKPLERERHNRNFHRAIYRSAHNRYLLKMLASLQPPMLLLGPATEVDAERVESAYREHVELVECIARRDVESAKACISKHLEAGQRIRTRQLLHRDDVVGHG